MVGEGEPPPFLLYGGLHWWGPMKYIFFLGEKKQKHIFAGGEKIFLTTFLPDRVDRVKFQNVFSR